MPPPTHQHVPQSQRHYWIGLALTLGFAALEIICGWLANSLALLGDAGHMLTDGFSLALAAFAAWMARKPASRRHSYGFGRVEVMAALANTLAMLAIAAAIVVEAVLRLRSPPPVRAPLVILIGAAGLLVNLFVYRVLATGERTLNLRAALLHVLGDALGSLAALAAGLVIWFSGWLPIDPLLSLFIAALIVASSLRLLYEAGHVLLEGVPRDVDLAELGRSMAGVTGVRSVHDLHVWSLSSNAISLSAHVVIDDMSAWQDILERLQQHLHAAYGIEHATLQPEPGVLARVPVATIARRDQAPDRKSAF